MLICEKQLPNNSVIREHPNLGDHVRIRCVRRILFSADNSFRNAPHRYRCFRKLPFIIHYKKNVRNATRRIALHRCEPAFRRMRSRYVWTGLKHRELITIRISQTSQHDILRQTFTKLSDACMYVL